MGELSSSEKRGYTIYKRYTVSNYTWTTDTQKRHISRKSENLGQSGRQNMLWPYLKILDWELIFGHAVKAISSPSV